MGFVVLEISLKKRIFDGVRVQRRRHMELKRRGRNYKKLYN